MKNEKDKILNAHRQHGRQFMGTQIVYPVLSRRSGGISIGVNLNIDKVCNFNCAYCQVDRSCQVKVDFSIETLEKELTEMIQLVLDGGLFEYEPFDQAPEKLRRLNDIALSGDGEPTASPYFLEACQEIVKIKEQLKLNDIKIIVITNSTMFNKEKVQLGLELLDKHNGEIWAKLDAGSEEYYKKVNQSKISFERILDNLLLVSQKRPIVIQTLMSNIDNEAPSESEIQNYIQRLEYIIANGGKIKHIQLHTIVRKTRQSNLTKLSDEQLDNIARMISNKIDVPLSKHYG
ncbi:MAG: radical SAM protein [Phycisphaerae bacterium]|nr:radical SAM protein [Phycisphaerae bacterium]